MADSNFTTKELASEEWQSIRDFHGCEISTLGRVRSCRSTHKGYFRPFRILKQTLGKNGYLYVNLSGRPRTVHRFVLEAFSGPCPNGLEACHFDGDRTNNRIGNLRWDTAKANSSDKARHGTHNLNGLANGRLPWKLNADHVRSIRALYGKHSQRQLARMFNVSQAMIHYIIKRKSWAELD